jgi:hypothetical protein
MAVHCLCSDGVVVCSPAARIHMEVFFAYE